MLNGCKSAFTNFVQQTELFLLYWMNLHETKRPIVRYFKSDSVDRSSESGTE